MCFDDDDLCFDLCSLRRGDRDRERERERERERCFDFLVLLMLLDLAAASTRACEMKDERISFLNSMCARETRERECVSVRE